VEGRTARKKEIFKRISDDGILFCADRIPSTHNPF
jgi:hypothetical protein